MHAKIFNFIFIRCKLESMGLEKHFKHYRYDTNFYIQHPMYMTPLILKLKLREKSDFRV